MKHYIITLTTCLFLSAQACAAAADKPNVIIVLTDDQAEDAEWRLGAYTQFLREDAPEDAIYDSLR